MPAHKSNCMFDLIWWNVWKHEAIITSGTSFLQFGPHKAGLGLFCYSLLRVSSFCNFSGLIEALSQLRSFDLTPSWLLLNACTITWKPSAIPINLFVLTFLRWVPLGTDTSIQLSLCIVVSGYILKAQRVSGGLWGHCVNLKERSSRGTSCFFVFVVTAEWSYSKSYWNVLICSFVTLQVLIFTQKRNDTCSLRGKADCFWLASPCPLS